LHEILTDKKIPACAGMTNRVILFTPNDLDNPECMCRCTQRFLCFAPLLLCAKPTRLLREIFSSPFFFLEKKEAKIQGCIKKAKILSLPLQRTMLRSAAIQL